MTQYTLKSLTMATAVIAMAAACFSVFAREANESELRSVGKGIKCYTTPLLQAGSAYKTTQVCFKGA